MNKLNNIRPVFLLILLLLSACNLPFVSTPEQQQPQTADDTMAMVNTLAAKTVQALETKLAVSPVAPQTTGETPDQTRTSAPSSTPIPTNTVSSLASTFTSTPLPVVNPTAILATPVPCDRASFISDVSIPDNTNFGQGTNFTKTWRLKNVGSCTWSTSYAIVFDSGNALNGPVSVNLPNAVGPGQTIDMSVNLKAPSADGVYQGFWKMQNASGARFGLTASNKSFWVKITVGSGYVNTPIPGTTITPIVTGSCQVTLQSPNLYAEFPVGGDFDSRWTVKNVGSTTWSASSIDYKYVSGTQMYKKDASYDLKSDVASGSSIDIIVDSIAPSSVGTYSMTWALVQGSTTLCNMTVYIRVK
jgi:hypothetical protein